MAQLDFDLDEELADEGIGPFNPSEWVDKVQLKAFIPYQSDPLTMYFPKGEITSTEFLIAQSEEL